MSKAVGLALACTALVFHIFGNSRATAASPPASLLDIHFADDATFNISLGGVWWLGSAPIRAFLGGKWQHLAKTGTARSTGSDVLGEFSCVNVTWASSAGHVLHTSLKTYAGSDIGIFVQQIPAGARHTNASNPTLPGGLRVMDPGNYDPVVAFPALAGGQLEELGFVTWQSRMINVEVGTNVTAGPPGQNEPLIQGRGLQGLSTSGPVVLFDEQFNSLVVAPMDNFKSAVHHVRDGATVWDTGVSSELTDLPVGFEHRTMLVGGIGITATMDAWGRALRREYNTNHTAVFDRNIEYLSYWTGKWAHVKRPSAQTIRTQTIS